MTLTKAQAGRVRHGPQTDAAVRAAIRAGLPITQVMEQYGVSRSYVGLRARQMGQPYPKSPGPDHPWRHPEARRTAPPDPGSAI